MIKSPSLWYVAFEGLIAAGKTTIAKLFAKASGAHLLLENFEENNFLADFYKDHNRWALPMQLQFLLSRHRQLGNSLINYNVPIVSDHTYKKDIIFARILLSERELRLYQTINQTLQHPMIEPTLIVYLDAPNEVLLDRIRLRNRLYETAITGQYLDQLREAYQCELLEQPNIKIIREDTHTLDLRSDSEMSALYNRILASIQT